MDSRFWLCCSPGPGSDTDSYVCTMQYGVQVLGSAFCDGSWPGFQLLLARFGLAFRSCVRCAMNSRFCPGFRFLYSVHGCG